jgi:transposase
MKTGVISLTREQHKILDTINKANAGYLTVREAAESLGLSERQTQRLKKEVKLDGPAALIHKNTLRKPPHALSSAIKEEILNLIASPMFQKVNFKHFQEILDTKYHITISYSALYRLLTGEGIKSPKTKRRFKPHRRRKRRAQAGILLQVDATPFPWFDDGVSYALHGAIDDATGQVTGLYLCKNECLLGYFEMLRRTVLTYGVPAAIYADRHTIFRSPNEDKRKMIDAPPDLAAHQTQFGRALSALSIQLIAARSPQAKGRVERLWQTLQSRLPVEFAMRDIHDVAAANDFLSSYIFHFNSEFAVEPSDSDSAFLPLEDSLNLDYILCVKEDRVMDHGYTLSYHGKTFKLVDSGYLSWLPPKARLSVLCSPRIGVKATYKNMVFDTTPMPKVNRPAKPVLPQKRDPAITVPGEPWTPKTGLPWRPGLPSYTESLEILDEIFSKPYTGRAGTYGRGVGQV